jgi:ribonuclease J
LPSIRPKEGSLYVFSSSEPHDEEQEIDFRRLHEWLKHFGIKGFGLPVEVKKENGKSEWEIPEAEKGLHASGHASGADVARAIREIDPQVIIPVHTENPGWFKERFDGVLVPEEGKRYSFGKERS